MKRDSSTMPNRGGALCSEQRTWRALLAGGIGCIVGMFALLTPETIPSLSCAFHEFTGYSCFTCGLTRSLLAIAHGHFSASIGHHLMGPVILLGMFLAMINLGTEALIGRRWNPGTHAGFWKGALVFFILLWITYGGIRLALELAG